MNPKIEQEFKEVYVKILSLEKRQTRILAMLRVLVDKK